MTPEQHKRLQACLEEAAAILYADSNPTTLTNLESIEQQVRAQMLEHVGPQIALFLSARPPVPAKGNSGPSEVVSG